MYLAYAFKRFIVKEKFHSDTNYMDDISLF